LTDRLQVVENRPTIASPAFEPTELRMNAKESPVPNVHHDTPVPGGEPKEFWGSDAVAAMLRALGIPYLALNPGASYRGLHDSIVNYLGNASPQMLLCLHEEAAIHIAQGYAKASGSMMGAVVHSNVGLMHASMAIFNAWCDRVPMLVLGATGPWDAAKRRPWIDWIHTASDQGALVRGFTKWDNQPGSPAAAYEALLRATQLANTAPRGPTYINLDAALQEQKIGALPPMPDPSRFRAPDPVVPAPHLVEAAARLLSQAKHPVILAGRVSRSESGWKERIALAEKLQARVFTDIKIAAAFPTDHPLHAAPPGGFLDEAAKKVLREADVVLSLDWIDTAGALKQAWGDAAIASKLIVVSPDQYVHRGWSMDYQGLPPADVYLLCEPEAAVPLLLEKVKSRPSLTGKKSAPAAPKDEVLSLRALAHAFNEASDGLDVALTRLPLGWNGAYRHFRHPLDYLGADGGGGVGAGPGLTVGTALALKGSSRIVVGILGDGDFLMGVMALWTATHYKLPCLILVANNRSFYNDEMHQERVARERSRPVENKWIGQRIDEPDIDLAMMARAQGAVGIGPVRELSKLKSSIEEGIRHVKGGAVCVVDVRVLPGYDANMSGASPSRK
jgi:thiamine pyrophosphate-dependent acetolactate synthase large subunit-like protein